MIVCSIRQFLSTRFALNGKAAKLIVPPCTWKRLLWRMRIDTFWKSITQFHSNSQCRFVQGLLSWETMVLSISTGVSVNINAPLNICIHIFFFLFLNSILIKRFNFENNHSYNFEYKAGFTMLNCIFEHVSLKRWRLQGWCTNPVICNKHCPARRTIRQIHAQARFTVTVKGCQCTIMIFSFVQLQQMHMVN